MDIGLNCCWQSSSILSRITCLKRFQICSIGSMSENTLDFKINGNINMDFLPGIHGSFKSPQHNLFIGGISFTVLSDYGKMFFQCISGRDFNIWLSRYHMYHTVTLSEEAITFNGNHAPVRGQRQLLA